MLHKDKSSYGTVSIKNTYLDLLNAVNNEHILQVLHGSVHPVVEWRRPLGELQVQLINCLPQLLHALQRNREKLLRTMGPASQWVQD